MDETVNEPNKDYLSHQSITQNLGIVLRVICFRESNISVSQISPPELGIEIDAKKQTEFF